MSIQDPQIPAGLVPVQADVPAGLIPVESGETRVPSGLKEVSSVKNQSTPTFKVDLGSSFRRGFRVDPNKGVPQGFGADLNKQARGFESDQPRILSKEAKPLAPIEGSLKALADIEAEWIKLPEEKRYTTTHEGRIVPTATRNELDNKTKNLNSEFQFYVARLDSSEREAMKLEIDNRNVDDHVKASLKRTLRPDRTPYITDIDLQTAELLKSANEENIAEDINTGVTKALRGSIWNVVTIPYELTHVGNIDRISEDLAALYSGIDAPVADKKELVRNIMGFKQDITGQNIQGAAQFATIIPEVMLTRRFVGMVGMKEIAGLSRVNSLRWRAVNSIVKAGKNATDFGLSQMWAKGQTAPKEVAHNVGAALIYHGADRGFANLYNLAFARTMLNHPGMTAKMVNAFFKTAGSGVAFAGTSAGLEGNLTPEGVLREIPLGLAFAILGNGGLFKTENYVKEMSDLAVREGYIKPENKGLYEEGLTVALADKTIMKNFQEAVGMSKNIEKVKRASEFDIDPNAEFPLKELAENVEKKEVKKPKEEQDVAGENEASKSSLERVNESEIARRKAEQRVSSEDLTRNAAKEFASDAESIAELKRISVESEDLNTRKSAKQILDMMESEKQKKTEFKPDEFDSYVKSVVDALKGKDISVDGIYNKTKETFPDFSDRDVRDIASSAALEKIAKDYGGDLLKKYIRSRGNRTLGMQAALDKLNAWNEVNKHRLIVIGKEFKRATDAESKQIESLLTNRGLEINKRNYDTLISDAIVEESVRMQLPEKTRGVVQKMRDFQTELSQILIDEKLVDRKVAVGSIAGNLPTYLARQYEMFTNPKWGKKIPKDTVAEMRSWLRATRPNLTETEISGVINEMIGAKPEFQSYMASGKTGSMNLDLLLAKKDVPEPVRKFLGEIKGAEAGMRSILRTADFIGKQRFLDDVYRDGMNKYIFEDRVGEFSQQIASEGSMSYHPLNGKYTLPVIADAMKEFGKQKPADWSQQALEWYLKLNGAVKYGMTRLNPGTISRNFLANGFIAMSNLHFGRNIPKAWSLVKNELGRMSSAERNAEVERLISMGVFSDSISKGMLRMWMDDMANSKDGNDIARFADRNVFQKTNEKIDKAYEMGDIFWKVLGFYQERARYLDVYDGDIALAERKASDIIKRIYPNFSTTSRFSKELSRFPVVGMFPGWTEAIAKSTWETLKLIREESGDSKTKSIAARRAAGFLIAAAIPAVWGAASKMKAGISEEDDEAIRRMSAYYSRHNDWIYLSNQDGVIEYFDMGNVDPYAFYGKPLMALQTEQGVKDKAVEFGMEIIRPWLGEEAFWNIANNLYNNHDEYGRPIRNTTDDIHKQVEDVLSYAIKRGAPGIVRVGTRSYDAMFNPESPSGKVYDIKNEALTVVGLRTVKLNMAVAARSRAFAFRKMASDLDRSYRENPSEEAYQRYVEKYTDGLTSLKEDYKAAKALGSKNLEQEFKKVRLSKDESDYIFKDKDLPVPESQMSDKEILRRERKQRKDERN